MSEDELLGILQKRLRIVITTSIINGDPRDVTEVTRVALYWCKPEPDAPSGERLIEIDRDADVPDSQRRIAALEIEVEELKKRVQLLEG